MSDPNDDSGGGHSLGGNRENLPSSWSRSGNSGPRVGRTGNLGGSNPSSSRSGAGRFATLSDLNSSGADGHLGHRHASPSDDDDDDDEDENSAEGESWFTGGERSGLSVQNPNHRPNIPGGDLVRELLRKAAQSGPPSSAPQEPTRRAFTGGGHTLGGEDVESQYIPDPDAPPPSANAAEEDRAIRHLTFWRDGFSVEDGPLLRYDDPDNAATLTAIDQGQAPPQLLNVRYGQPVELRVARRTDEDYKPPPKRPTRAFEGSGHRLGALVPDFTPQVPGAFPDISGSSQASSSTPAREPQSVQTKFEVDQSKPTTSIQLRLADGTRLVCRMNLTHTVGDIRNFINAARPENLTRPYTIATTFPNRVLEDDTQTIEAAGLKNSVVVQRWA